MAPVSLFARNYLSSVVKLKHNHTHLNCLRALSFRMMPLVSFIIMALGLCLSLSLVSESKPLHRKHRSEPGGLLFNYPYHPGKTVFKLHQNLVGRDFFQAFRWETENDPTHGRVNYVDMKTAIAENLTHGRKSIVNDEPFNCNPDMTVATNDSSLCVSIPKISSRPLLEVEVAIASHPTRRIQIPFWSLMCNMYQTLYVEFGQHSGP